MDLTKQPKATRGEFCGGPWDDELDAYAFRDGETGLVCVIQRHFSEGHLVAAVALPENHPWNPMGGAAIDERMQASEELNPLRPHAGVSLCDHRPGARELAARLALADVPHGTEWVGFHAAADLGNEKTATPKIVTHQLQGKIPKGWVYRDLDYVRGELAKLAKAVHMTCPVRPLPGVV